MNPPKPARRLRLRKADVEQAPGASGAADAPRLTRTPWHGRDPFDWPREAALAQCPSARCRRAKACIAPVKGGHCQRTHYTPEEQQRLKPLHPLFRALAQVPEVADAADLAERLERIAALAEVRRAYDREMAARWKAGLLPARFGPFRASGVVLEPPPRHYVEIAPPPPQKRWTRVQGRGTERPVGSGFGAVRPLGRAISSGGRAADS